MNFQPLALTRVVALTFLVLGTAVAQQSATTEPGAIGLLFATVGIDGRGERSLVLDTGASSTAILNERLGPKLRFDTNHTVTLSGAGSDDCKAAVTAPLEVTVSGLKLKPVEIQLIDLTAIEQFVGRRIEGVIGGDLFRQYAVSLDFATSRATALGSHRGYADYTSIPMSSRYGLCCIVELHLSVANRNLKGRFLIDTGAPTIAVALTPSFAREHNLLPAATGQTVTLPSLCASSLLSVYGDIAEVDIGTVHLRHVNVLLSLDHKGAFASGAFDGIIGGLLLRRFGEVVVDVPNSRVLIKSPGARK